MYQEEMIYYRDLVEVPESKITEISYINNLSTHLEREPIQLETATVTTIASAEYDSESDGDPMDEYIFFDIRK